MRRSALIALVFAVSASADHRTPSNGISLPMGCRDRSCVRSRAAVATEPDPSTVPPYFAFAPSSGAGMTAPCACTALTGSQGEAMTFSRASTAMCLKGATQSGIANGDMVRCAVDKPRAMAGGDGSGATGLLMEPARTNDCALSENFNDINWTPVNSGSSDPVVTANTATSPLGTVSADRVQLPATSGANYSGVFYLAGCPLGTQQSLSVYARADGGTPTLDVCLVATSGGYFCMPSGCTLSSSSWTHCELPNVTSADLAYFAIGNLGALISGTPSRGASDVLLWGAQCEGGASVSSYIQTDGGSVARAADVASFSVSLDNDFHVSHGATVIASGAVSNNRTGYELYSNPSASLGYLSSANWRTNFFANTLDHLATAGGTVTAGSAATVSSYFDGAAVGSCQSPSCTKANQGLYLPSGANTFYVGTRHSTGNELNGVVKQVCLDPAPSKCIPTGGYAASSVTVATNRSSSTAAFVGDSILAGSLVTTKPPSRVLDVSPYFWTYNAAATLDYAVSGHTSAQCLTDWNNSVKNTSAGVLFLSCGINSARTGVAAASIEADLDSIAASADDAGMRVGWATITPGASYAGCDATCVSTISAVNSHTATRCAALSNCYLVPAFATFTDGANALRADCDNGDGLHLNDACTKEFSSLLAGATR